MIIEFTCEFACYDGDAIDGVVVLEEEILQPRYLLSRPWQSSLTRRA